MKSRIRVSDNRRDWRSKELKRLFPNGDIDDIYAIMGNHLLDPYEYFYPRKFKECYPNVGSYNEFVNSKIEESWDE